MGTREKLIKAAIKLFEEKGYVGTTTTAVATSAGVAEVTLFRYFGNKETLFKESLKEIRQEVPTGLHEWARERDFHLVLKEQAQALSRYALKESRLIRMMLFESIRSPELKNLLYEGPLQAIKSFREFFAYHIWQGHMADGDPALYADAFVSLIFGYATTLASYRDDQDEAEKMAALEIMIDRIFLRGIEK